MYHDNQQYGMYTVSMSVDWALYCSYITMSIET